MSFAFAKHHLKPLIGLAWPIMLGQAGHVITGFADAFIVGKYLGHIELAAQAFAQSIFLIFMVFGVGYAMGITPLISNAHAAQQHSRIRNLFVNGQLSAIFLAIGLCLLMLIIGTQLDFLGQEEVVSQTSKPYYFWIVLSLFPQIMFMFYKQFAEGLSLTRMAMIVSLVGNGVNIILNFALVLGLWGFKEYGLEGAGIATCIARVLMTLAMLVYCKYHREINTYFTFNTKRISKLSQVKLVQLGLPIGLQFVFEAGAFSVAAIMMGWFGAEALAAHQIALQVAALTYLLASGIAGAVSIRVGNFFGKLDWPNVRTGGFTGIHLTFLFMAVCAICLYSFRYTIPVLFTDNSVVVEYAGLFLIWAAVFQLSDGIQVSSNAVLRGLQDVKTPTIITFCAYWLTAIPVGYFASHYFMGPSGIWMGLTVGLTIAAVILYQRFNRSTKHHITSIN